MEDFEMMLQQVIQHCLDVNVDPAAMIAHLREVADEIEADIEVGAYEE